MKGIYIVLVLLIAASALGCISQKQSGTSTSDMSTKPTASPAETSVPSNGAETDEFGTDADLAAMDSIFDDMNMDMSLSEVSADAFT